MSFGDYIKSGWEVAKLRSEAVTQLAADRDAIGPAIGILAIGGAAAGIGALNLGAIFLLPIARVIGAFVFTAVVHFCATALFDGKGQFTAFAIPVFCASVIGWITFIPFVGPFILAPLTGLWMLVVMVVSAETVYGVDRGRAIASVAIPLVIFLVIGVLFALLAGVGLLALSGRF
jgi:hypothetical protein